LHRQFLETQAEATRIFERLWSGAPHTAPRPQPIAAASSRATTAPIVAPAPAPASASSAAWTPAAPPVAVPIAVPSSGSGSGVTPPTSMSDRSAIAGTVLRVVVENTGYPIGMLELGMGLDADLGIDSIKRVEILSALQEALPQAPILGSDQLSDLRTLADIVAALAAGGEPDSGATASDATTS